MLPFFRFLTKFNFDDDGVSRLQSEELSHSFKIYMGELLQILDVDVKDDLLLEQQLREEMQNQESKLKRKKSDYYKLGSLSLLYYMERFISDKDLTLFQIFILAQCYLGKPSFLPSPFSLL